MFDGKRFDRNKFEWSDAAEAHIGRPDGGVHAHA